MNLKMCHCRQCRYCRRHKRNQFHIVYMRRSSRTRTRQMLKLGRWEMVPEKISLNYFG